MPAASARIYWIPSFETFYNSYFQELASEQLASRWQRLDFGIGFLVALTASGSAVSGWALWNQAGWRSGWLAIAGTAGIAAIFHRVLGVTNRVKEQEELRRLFVELRVGLETFRHKLKIGIDEKDAETQFTRLRERYAECMGRTRTDMAFTNSLRLRVQDHLDEILQNQIRHDSNQRN